MLIINNAMAKSASTLLYAYTLQLLEAAFTSRGQDELRKLTAAGAIDGVGDFVRKLDDRALDLLVDASQRKGPVLVKVHHELTPSLERRLRDGSIKSTFNHRDPRDMILSAMDHHARSLREGTPRFEYHTSVSDSMKESRWWCRLSCEWVASGLACVFLYRDLVTDPLAQLRRLCDYLDLPLDDDALHAAIARELELRKVGQNEFNTGLLTRYQTEMADDDIALCNAELGEFITALGYDLGPAPAASPRAPRYRRAS